MTPSMIISLRKNTMFGWFKESDEYFEKKNIPQILAVLAVGINGNKEWVKYVLDRKHRYQIELHGFIHCNHQFLPESHGYQLLKEARDRINDTFHTKVTRWYVPFSRLGFPEWGPRVCDRLGLKFHTKGGTARHFYYHPWNTRSVRNIKNIIKNEERGKFTNPKRVSIKNGL